MTKRIEIRIDVDGTINAETKEILGHKCTDYVAVLEELLDSVTINSKFTDEYLTQDETQNMNIGAEDGGI